MANTSKTSSQLPLGAIMLSICIGVAGGLGATSLMGRLAPGSSKLAAMQEAAEALWTGKANAMREAFAHEIAQEKSSGVYALPSQGVGLKLIFGEKGALNSFSKFNPASTKPCMLELAIDGSGDPSLRASTFSSFAGKILDSPLLMPPPEALASAFTVAHELGHCDLHARPSAAPAEAFFASMASKGFPASPGSKPAAERYFQSQFGYVSFQESYADGLALIALARRMSALDFEAAAKMLLLKRQRSSLRLESGKYPTPYQTHLAIPFILQQGHAKLAELQSPEASRLAMAAAAQGSILFLGALQADGSTFSGKAFPESPTLAGEVALAAQAHRKAGAR